MKLLILLLLLNREIDSISPNLIGDTIMKDTAYNDTASSILDEVILIDRRNIKNEILENYRIKKRILKVWKYAIMTQDELERLEKTISKIDKKKRKEYIEITEEFIRKNFEETLKKLYIQDGQVLLKLIYRQTGRTAYDISKQFRSTWTAFWWNATAFFFDLSLKSEYNPEENVEDFLIEKNLQELFSLNKIEKREAKMINPYTPK